MTERETEHPVFYALRAYCGQAAGRSDWRFRRGLCKLLKPYLSEYSRRDVGAQIARYLNIDILPEPALAQTRATDQMVMAALLVDPENHSCVAQHRHLVARYPEGATTRPQKQNAPVIWNDDVEWLARKLDLLPQFEFTELTPDRPGVDTRTIELTPNPGPIPTSANAGDISARYGAKTVHGTDAYFVSRKHNSKTQLTYHDIKNADIVMHLHSRFVGQEGHYFPSLSFGPLQYLERNPQPQTTTRIDQPSILMFSPYGAKNFAHLLLDVLAPILYLPDDVLEGRALIFDGRAEGLVRKLAPSFFPNSDLIFVDRFQRLQVDKLLIFPTLPHPLNAGHKGLLRRVKTRFGLTAKSGSHRIYVRREAGRRAIENEAAVTACLEGHGFESHELAGMSFEDQVRLFSTAESVIGLHGAGLSNCIFMPSGGKLFEIMPERYSTSAFLTLAGANELSHYIIPTDADLDSHSFSTHHAQTRVPLDELERIVSENL